MMKNKKFKLCILQLRDLTLRDIRFARMLKPFEDYHMVEYVPHSAEKELGLIFNAIQNRELAQFIGQDTLTMTPTQIFQHLHTRSQQIPLLISCYKDENGNYHQFTALKVHQDLQSLIITAKSRGWIDKNAKTPNIKG